ncbi:hypothetical protein L9F63_018098, partial [Diploptera punctata]
ILNGFFHLFKGHFTNHHRDFLRKDFRAVGRGLAACGFPTFRQRLRPASSRQPLTMPDALSGET